MPALDKIKDVPIEVLAVMDRMWHFVEWLEIFAGYRDLDMVDHSAGSRSLAWEGV